MLGSSKRCQGAGGRSGLQDALPQGKSASSPLTMVLVFNTTSSRSSSVSDAVRDYLRRQFSNQWHSLVRRLCHEIYSMAGRHEKMEWSAEFADWFTDGVPKEDWPELEIYQQHDGDEK